MRRVTALGAIIALAMIPGAWGNPLPCYEIVYVNVSPPQIGLLCCDSVTLSGDTIFTLSGIAIVDSGVWADVNYDEQNPFLLDSTNTSGFVLNPEADSVDIHMLSAHWGYLDPVGWGTLGRHSVPLEGYSTEIRDYWCFEPPFGYHLRVLSFDFTIPRQGYGPVILNEINSHSTWAGNSNFIELYNTSGNEVDLSNWMVICDTICRIHEGAHIAPHGVWALDQALFPASFDMDYAGDNIYLVNSDSEIVDQVGWSSDHGENVSFMRFPDGNADTLYQAGYWGYNDQSSDDFSNGFPSRCAPNRYQSPGLKVIGTHADTSGGLVNIFWTNPIWVANFDRAILRKSLSGFPQAPTDGQLVYEGPAQEFLGDQAAPGQTTYYTVFAHTSDDAYSEPDSESKVSVFMPLVSIDDEPLPESPLLLSCYPNPFNASVTIEFSAGELTVYNIAGQKVATLAQGTAVAGEHRMVWDASGFPSGIYFVRLESGGRSRGVKLTLVK